MRCDNERVGRRVTFDSNWLRSTQLWRARVVPLREHCGDLHGITAAKLKQSQWWKRIGRSHVKVANETFNQRDLR
jgi:hypothetical protein